MNTEPPQLHSPETGGAAAAGRFEITREEFDRAYDTLARENREPTIIELERLTGAGTAAVIHFLFERVRERLDEEAARGGLPAPRSEIRKTLLKFFDLAEQGARELEQKDPGLAALDKPALLRLLEEKERARALCEARLAGAQEEIARLRAQNRDYLEKILRRLAELQES